MIKRVIEISSGPTRLSVANRQLVIEREDRRRATLPCEDIGVLVVDNNAVSYTHSVFTTLIDAGAAIVLCGGDHHPAGLVMPLAGNTVQTERHRGQIEAAQPLLKRLWQIVVSGKLQQQSFVLSSVAGTDEGLRELAGRVRSGDPDNLEAQGAQRYWPKLMGTEFRRSRAGPPPNNLLNYGYMVLRAGMARAVCAAGLIPTLGLHHRNRYNPFCLADDLMEPYRPFVDLRVAAIVRDGFGAIDIDRPMKQRILSIFGDTLTIAGQRSPLMLALHSTAASLVSSLESGRPGLALPEGLPVPVPSNERS